MLSCEIARVLFQCSLGRAHHGLCRLNVGGLQLSLRHQRLGLCLGRGHVGFRLRDRRSIIVIDDLGQDLSGVHTVIVLHRQVADVTGNLRGDGGHVCLQICVVRRLPLGIALPIGPAARDYDQDADGNDEDEGSPNHLGNRAPVYFESAAQRGASVLKAI